MFAAQFVLGEYHHTNVARIMVLAAYAVGYNLLLGYTGLMSLGHAMFFAAGMYGAGLSIYYLEFGGGQDDPGRHDLRAGPAECGKGTLRGSRHRRDAGLEARERPDNPLGCGCGSGSTFC